MDGALHPCCISGDCTPLPQLLPRKLVDGLTKSDLCNLDVDDRLIQNFSDGVEHTSPVAVISRIRKDNRTYLEVAYRLDSDNHFGCKAQVHCWPLGEIHFAAGQHIEPLGTFQKAVAVRPLVCKQRFNSPTRAVPFPHGVIPANVLQAQLRIDHVGAVGQRKQPVRLAPAKCSLDRRSQHSHKNGRHRSNCRPGIPVHGARGAEPPALADASTHFPQDLQQLHWLSPCSLLEPILP